MHIIARTELCGNTCLCRLSANEALCAIRPRKHDHELSSLTMPTTNAELPAVPFHNALSDCHAQTRSFSLGRKEWFKNFLPLLASEAGAVVPDRNPQRRLAVEYGFRPGNRDFDRVGAGCERVFENVANTCSMRNESALQRQSQATGS